MDTVGTFEVLNHNTIAVNELPVGVWTDNYQTYLQSLVNKEDSFVKDFQSEGDDNIARFLLTVDSMALQKYVLGQKTHEIEKLLRLRNSLNTSNMNLILCDGSIAKFTNVSEIMEYFYKVRFIHYNKRKTYILDRFRWKLQLISNKLRFVQEIIDESIVPQKQTKSSLLKLLKEKGYDEMETEYKIPTELYNEIFEGNRIIEETTISSTINEAGETAEEEEEVEEEELQQEESAAARGLKNSQEEIEQIKYRYDYLITMPLYNLTKDIVTKLETEKNQKELEYNNYANKRIEDIWSEEIEQFKKLYQKLESDFIKENYQKDFSKNKRINNSTLKPTKTSQTKPKTAKKK